MFGPAPSPQPVTAITAPDAGIPISPPPHPDAALAAKLYAPEPEPKRLAVPDNITKLRAADTARAFYAESGPSADAVGAVAEHYAEIYNDLPEAQRQAGALEAAEMARDIGLTDGDVRQWVGFANVLRTNPVPAEQAQSAAAQRLVELFGKDAQQALDDARALVARDPRVGPMLARSGLGNHPEVIAHFARQAMRERVKGRL